MSIVRTSGRVPSVAAWPLLPALFLLLLGSFGLTKVAEASDAKRLIVISGHTIRSVPVGKGPGRVIRRFPEGVWISSVSTALRTTDIAYSLRIKRLKGGYTLLKDQVWTMRADGTNPKMHFEQVRKRNRLGLISSEPEYWGPRYGIQRVELAPGGRRIMVTKDFPFIAFEIRPGHKGMRLVNPKTKDDVYGISNPTYDHTGRRVLGYINGGKVQSGIGYVVLKSGKAVTFTNRGYDFLSSTMSASSDGRFLTVLGSVKKDQKPNDGVMLPPYVTWLIDWNGRRIRMVKGPEPVVGPIEYPRISPDGKLIAFTTDSRSIGSPDARTWVVSVRGGRARLVHTGRSSFREQFPEWVWTE